MSAWDLSEADSAALHALLATVPLPAVDDEPAAPEVALVEQGTLDLASSVALRARAAALAAAGALAVREAVLFAEQVDVLVQVSRLTPVTTDRGSAHNALGLELGGTRGLGQQQALRDMFQAVRLTEVLPLTLAGLRAGSLLLGQARAIVGASEHCSAAIASEAERRLFADPRAGRLSPSDLRSTLTRLVLQVEGELDPDAQDARERDAAEGRRVSSFPLPDGMAGMFVEWTGVQGLSFTAALDELCRRVKAWDLTQGINRTAAQRRADVLAALPGWVLEMLDRPGADRPTRAPEDSSEAGEAAASPEADAPAGADPAPDSKASDEPTATATGTSDDEEPSRNEEPSGDAGQPTEPPVGPPRAPTSPPAPPPSPPPLPLPGCLTTPSRTPRWVANVHIPLASGLGLSQVPGYLERYGWISAALARRLLPGAELCPVHVDEHGQPLHTSTRPRSPHEDDPDEGPGGVPAADVPRPQGDGPASGAAGNATAPSPRGGSNGFQTPHDWRTARPRTTAQDVQDLLLAWGALPPPQVITTPEPQYVPSAGLARHVRTRDLRCTGPGCAQPSHLSELDHLDPWHRGGPTAAWNLAPKSHRCHDAKTHGGWTTQRHDDGSTTWTSPLARRYWTPAFWTAPPQVQPGTRIPALHDEPHEPTVRLTEERDAHAPRLRRELDAQAQQVQQDAEARTAQQAAPVKPRPRPQTGSWLDWLNPTAGPDDEPPPF